MISLQRVLSQCRKYPCNIITTCIIDNQCNIIVITLSETYLLVKLFACLVIFLVFLLSADVFQHYFWNNIRVLNSLDPDKACSLVTALRLRINPSIYNKVMALDLRISFHSISLKIKFLLSIFIHNLSRLYGRIPHIALHPFYVPFEKELQVTLNLFTLKAPITTKVVHFCRMLKYF